MFRSNKENRDSQMRKHIVETKQLQTKGLQTGALEKDKSDSLFLGSNWHRVCALLTNKKMHFLVFWSKKSPKDKPSWENQISSY